MEIEVQKDAREFLGLLGLDLGLPGARPSETLMRELVETFGNILISEDIKRVEFRKWMLVVTKAGFEIWRFSLNKEKYVMSQSFTEKGTSFFPLGEKLFVHSWDQRVLYTYLRTGENYQLKRTLESCFSVVVLRNDVIIYLEDSQVNFFMTLDMSGDKGGRIDLDEEIHNICRINDHLFGVILGDQILIYDFDDLPNSPLSSIEGDHELITVNEEMFATRSPGGKWNIWKLVDYSLVKVKSMKDPGEIHPISPGMFVFEEGDGCYNYRLKEASPESSEEESHSQKWRRITPFNPSGGVIPLGNGYFCASFGESYSIPWKICLKRWNAARKRNETLGIFDGWTLRKGEACTYPGTPSVKWAVLLSSDLIAIHWLKNPSHPEACGSVEIWNFNTNTLFQTLKGVNEPIQVLPLPHTKEDTEEVSEFLVETMNKIPSAVVGVMKQFL